jgi:hypothetical protein
VSVRRVTEINAGRKTAGIDGKVVLFPEHKAELADWVQFRSASWKAKPVKRVYIPMSNGKKRPTRNYHEPRIRQGLRRSSEVSESFLVVTHPFHPLSGQWLRVLFERR